MWSWRSGNEEADIVDEEGGIVWGGRPGWESSKQSSESEGESSAVYGIEEETVITVA